MWFPMLGQTNYDVVNEHMNSLPANCAAHCLASGTLLRDADAEVGMMAEVGIDDTDSVTDPALHGRGRFGRAPALNGRAPAPPAPGRASALAAAGLAGDSGATL